MHHLIQLIHLSPKPFFFFKARTRNPSNMNIGFLNMKLAKQTTIIAFHQVSLTISIAYKICLPSKKAFWELDTTLPTINSKYLNFI